MVVRIGAPVVASRPVGVTELAGETARYENLETLLHGGQRDSGHLVPHAEKHFVRRGVDGGMSQKPIDRRALIGEAMPPRLERLAEELVAGIGCSGHVAAIPLYLGVDP